MPERTEPRVETNKGAAPEAQEFIETRRFVETWLGLAKVLPPDAEGDAKAAMSADFDAIIKRLNAQAVMSADFEAILKRLDEGIPRLFEDMKELHSSLRRPLVI